MILLIFFLINAASFDYVKYIDNYDGDTIFFDIPKLPPIFGKRMSVRLTGIDAPEIKAKKECEKELAIKVKDKVKILLINAKKISLKNCFKDKYFRLNCKIIFDNTNLADYLLEHKMAIHYDGKTKKDHNWCE